MSPDLVLLPGLDGTGRLFRPFLEVARSNGTTCRPIVYPTEPLSYAELTDFAKAELPDEECVLVAESFSGPIGIELARRSSRVRALVLVASFDRSPLATWQQAALSMFGWTLFHGPPPPWAVRRFMVGNAPDALISAVRDAVRSVPAPVLLQRIQNIAALEPLAPIEAPTLWLHASHDRLLDRRTPRWGDEKVIEGPHLLLQVRPHDCYDTITSFLRFGETS